MGVEGRIVGLSLAVVDYKINRNGDNLLLPTDREALVPFLEEVVKKQGEFVVCAGGSITSAMHTFAALSKNPFRLFSAIGNDFNGEIYKTATSAKLGHPQIIEGQRTGVWIALLRDGGYPEGLSFHGAGDKVRISKGELQEEKNSLFMTDITSCKKEEIFDSLDEVLKIIKNDNGIFALGLGGSRPNGVPRNKLASMFSSFWINPDIIFGNEQEFLYATGAPSVEAIIDRGFPQSRLVIVTCDARGVKIRFEGENLSVPAQYVSPDRIIDQTGAGDTFIGTMLGSLYAKPYSSWTHNDVEKAAQLASIASSLVLQIKDSRLRQDQIATLRELM